MINTGGIDNRGARVYITDDVNDKNIEMAILAYNNHDMYIDSKFSTPSTYDINIGNSLVINSILNFVEQATVGFTDAQKKTIMAKVKFWCIDKFFDIINKIEEHKAVSIFIDSNLTKHEWIMLGALHSCGVSMFIVTENISYDKTLFGGKERVEEFGTGLSMNYKNNGVAEMTSDRIKNTADIETALYENGKPIHVVVSGVENMTDTPDFYGKLYITCKKSEQFSLFNGTFGPPDYKESSRLPRIERRESRYIIETLSMYLNTDNIDLKKSFKSYFETLASSGKLNANELHNNMATVLCKINEITSYTSTKVIVYYGVPSDKDRMILEILSGCDKYSVVVLISDKNNDTIFKNMYTITLPESHAYFDMPVTDSRDTVRTVASSVETRMNNEIFNGDAVGVYRAGSIERVKNQLYSTTYDEISMWWEQDVCIRKGYSSAGRVANIPTIFAIVHGEKAESPNKNTREMSFVDRVSSLITDKDKTCLFRSVESFCATAGQAAKTRSEVTRNPMGSNNTQGFSVITRATDMWGTPASEQKPFYENGRLNKDRIMSGVNYNLGILSTPKQIDVLEAIEEIINEYYIRYDDQFKMSKEQYIDAVLNVLLNLPITLLNQIQFFDGHGVNPKVVIISSDTAQFTLDALIMLQFLRLMCFDVVIFVPTTYNTIENKVGPEFRYTTHKIGQPLEVSKYMIDHVSIQSKNRNRVSVNNDYTDNDNKKPGFFKRLFGVRD